MSGEMEVGACDVCGKQEVAIERTYFLYDIKCDCHSPQHFELVRHCRNCIPQKPKYTTFEHNKEKYIMDENGGVCTKETHNRNMFAEELAALINRYSQENVSGTPDYMLAQYLVGCLSVYEETIKNRDEWYDFTPFAR